MCSLTIKCVLYLNSLVYYSNDHRTWPSTERVLLPQNVFSYYLNSLSLQDMAECTFQPQTTTAPDYVLRIAQVPH